MNTIYLVTGAAGHLGSTVVRELLKRNKQVRGLVLSNEKNLLDNIEIVYGDVLDKISLQVFFRNENNQKLVVIHCAGIVSISSKFNQKVYDVNVVGTKNIVDLALEHNVSKLIYVSSVHALFEKPKGEVISETKDFNPDNIVGLYAKTKTEATAYVLESAKKGLNASVVHPSGIIGPYDYGNNHLTALIIDYYNGKLVAGIKGGYDFVDVRDVTYGILAAVEKAKTGECYILSNQYYSVNEILDLLSLITNKKKVKIYMPIWFIKLVAPLAEMYYKILKKPPLFTAYSIYTLNSNALFSNKKAQEELGYSTRDIKETLEDTIAWLKEIKRI